MGNKDLQILDKQGAHVSVPGLLNLQMKPFPRNRLAAYS